MPFPSRGEVTQVLLKGPSPSDGVPPCRQLLGWSCRQRRWPVPLDEVDRSSELPLGARVRSPTRHLDDLIRLERRTPKLIDGDWVMYQVPMDREGDEGREGRFLPIVTPPERI